jgi:hypothetical protein
LWYHEKPLKKRCRIPPAEGTGGLREVQRVIPLWRGFGRGFGCCFSLEREIAEVPYQDIDPSTQ